MSGSDRLLLGVLVLTSVLWTMLCCAFALSYLGPVPFPITALLLGLGNLLLLRLATGYTASAWRFAPLLASGLVALLATFPGPAGSTAWLPSGLPIPLLAVLALGFGIPAMGAARLP